MNFALHLFLSAALTIACIVLLAKIISGGIQTLYEGKKHE